MSKLKDIGKYIGVKAMNAIIYIVFKFLRTYTSMEKLKKSLEMAKDAEKDIESRIKELDEEMKDTIKKREELEKQRDDLDPELARNRLKDFIDKDGGS